MTRQVWLVAAVLGSVLVTNAVDLAACGDKFLRIGRSPRHTYAAVHRASILLYVPKADASRVKNYEKALKSAGHKPLAVRDLDTLSSALARNKYDIVITSLAEATRLREITATAATQPSLLPVVSEKDLKTARAEIKRQFEHHLEDGATAVEVFKEIDHVMELRLNNLP